MPRFDGSGPTGEGPMTGRGQGNCASDSPGTVGRFAGFGAGIGRGLGMARRFGFGRGARGGRGAGFGPGARGGWRR